MARDRFVRQKPLTLAEQSYFLKTAFPQFAVKVNRTELRCIGELHPGNLSDNYTVKIVYSIPLRPKVHVLSPELRLAKGCDRLPHVFDGNELCLYLAGEWRPDLRISDYIIPWIALWLRFYEVWLGTGSWEGGGTHPEAPWQKSR